MCGHCRRIQTAERRHQLKQDKGDHRQTGGENDPRQQGQTQLCIDAMRSDADTAFETDGEKEVDRQRLGSRFGNAQIRPGERGGNPKRKGQNDR